MTVPPMSVVVGPAHQIVVTAQSATTITATLTATTPIAVTVTAPAMRQVEAVLSAQGPLAGTEGADSTAFTGQVPVQGALACTDGADIGACIGQGEPESFITFTDHEVSTADENSYTFAGQALGPAFANRKVVIGIGGRSSAANRTITSVKVHVPDIATDPTGITATSVIQVTSSTNNFSRTALFEAAIPAGTTGDIVVNWSSSVARCGIGVWARKGAAVGTAVTETSVASPAVDTLTVPADGGAIGYSFAVDTTTARTATWTNMTEDFDEVIETTVTQSGASTNSTGSIEFTCTYSVTPNTGVGTVFAAWGP